MTAQPLPMPSANASIVEHAKENHRPNHDENQKGAPATNVGRVPTDDWETNHGHDQSREPEQKYPAESVQGVLVHRRYRTRRRLLVAFALIEFPALFLSGWLYDGGLQPVLGLDLGYLVVGVLVGFGLVFFGDMP